jgi:deoxyribodipyrimidine photo-lyase
MQDWRELNYSWCWHTLQPGVDLSSPSVLPKWSRDTLLQHQPDARPDVKSLEALESAATGDDAWDAMQHQLNEHGELHNNIRMTWGRQFVKWSATVAESIWRAQHLNDKYALDGGDPCSHCGILWCHGLFDSPKAAVSTAIYGSVAQRSTGCMQRRARGGPREYKALPIAGSTGRYVP